MVEIILEIIKKMIKNRKVYFKQIASIMFTIATIVIVECVSEFTESLSEYENNAPPGFSELRINVDAADTECSDDVLYNACVDIRQIINKMDDKCIRIESDDWTEGSISGLKKAYKAELYSFTPGCFIADSLLTGGRNMTALEEKYNLPVAVIPDNMFDDISSYIGKKLEITTDDNSAYELTIIGAYDNSDRQKSDTFSIYVNYSYLLDRGLITDNCSETDYFVSKEKASGIEEYLKKYLAVNYPEIAFELTGDTADDGNSDSVTGAIRIIVEFFLMVAFIVGNVGILTMALIKVSDQVKAFGIKQAIGASRFHVGMEIATETVLLSMIGTLLGAGIGLLAGNMIGFYLSSRYNALISVRHIIVPVRTICISALCSAAISLVFSQIPVRKALKMSITEAMRSKD